VVNRPLGLALAVLLAGCGAHVGAAGTVSAPRRAARPPAPSRTSPPARAMAHFHPQARAGILIDATTGRVLWQLHPTEVLPIASLTKMMTALLVVTRAHADAEVRVTKQALAYRGSGVGLLPKGRRVPLEPLLYGLLLPSGNDAAIALAQHVASGSITRFVAAMNAKATRLDLGCTHYTSPDGYDNGNRSCAADLARLAAVDLAQPRIAHIVAQRSAILHFPIKGGKLYLYNNNPLLRYGFPGATGLKTGETDAAGKCLVGTATRGGVSLVSVLLNAPHLDKQAAALLEAGFREEG
jgi:D-alanyl-D-alanine carboxypeptidase (penicillin-binding protein 5/6)